MIRSYRARCLLAAALCLSGWLASVPAAAHDLTRLPLGDGKLSTAPKAGWIWACRIDPQAGGAGRDGPWINQAQGTYDLTKKAVVPGSATWPYNFRVTVQNGQRVFTTNDFPSHPTGTYPIPANSEAYKVDRNPNRISQQDMLLQLPLNPTLSSQPTCVPGAIGILLSGSVLFNALDAPGRDAVAHETQDECQGHPQVSGVYHYHSVSPCVDKAREADGHSKLVGYLLDGFGIFGRYGEGGKLLTSADLDACHGHTHMIAWDGKQVSMYHYHATWDFPYTAGCMRGRYSMRDVMTISGPPPQGMRGGQGMPGAQGPGGQQAMGPGGQQSPGSGGPQGMGPGGQQGMGPGGQQGMGPGGPQGMGPGGPQAMGGQQGGGPGGRHPDLNVAAAKLGIPAEQLRRALGPPPPDLEAAARQLGISSQRLREALDASR